MKKIILSLAVTLFAATSFAQSVSKENWAVGGRIGSGFQAVAQYNGLGNVAGKPFYLEGRFGMSWCNQGTTLTADFTALAAWRCFEFGQYSAGNFFTDFGCGVNVGGKSNYCYVGPAGLARIGFKFTGAPVSLSFDWTPVFGAEIFYASGSYTVGEDVGSRPAPQASAKIKYSYTDSRFYGYGLLNFGITCTYHF